MAEDQVHDFGTIKTVGPANNGMAIWTSSILSKKEKKLSGVELGLVHEFSYPGCDGMQKVDIRGIYR